MANYSQSGESDFAVQIAPGISESGADFDIAIGPTVSGSGLFDIAINNLKSSGGPSPLILELLQAVRTKQILGFDLTESKLGFADSGDNTGGAWVSTWVRSRDSSDASSFWDITLPKGTYLVVISIIGQMVFSSTDQGVVHVGLSTDDTTDDNSGIVVNSLMQMPVGGIAVDQESFFGGTHAYIQAVSSGGQTFTVKRTVSGTATVATTNTLSQIGVGKTVDGLLVDGSVIRAYRIGQ